VSNFRFLPLVFGEEILLPMSNPPLPNNGSCAQAVADKAVTDRCRHLLICFATATYYNTLQHKLQHTATQTATHTAIHCNTLQHTATHCNTLQHAATHCNTLQHTATHCNTLQHTGTHCNTPAIKRLRTRSTAARQVSNAHERDLDTNQNV